MSKHTEERLRQTLTSRAEQVTPESLRPTDPSLLARSKRLSSIAVSRPSWVTWGVPIMAAAATAIVVAVLAYTDVRPDEHTTPVTPPNVVTGSSCPHEESLIATALDKDTVMADVDGDGAPDLVATAVDGDEAPACRAFVGVRTANGATYSTALDAPAVPPSGVNAEVIGVPDLGADGRADIVVDTHAMADGALAQLFTLTETGLVRVVVPAFEDGNVVVEGGGTTSPQAAGCTAEGSLVISLSTSVDHGERYTVTRQIYPVTGNPIEFGDLQVRTAEVSADRLATQIPEFGDQNFAACDGEVRTSQ